MLLAIDKLPVDIEIRSAYRYFHIKHDESMEALHAMVLNDICIERLVSQASTEYGFERMTTEEYVRVINNAISDRNSLRDLIDRDVQFTPEQMETTERDFQRILLTQIHGYLKTGKQDLTDKGIRHTVSPGIGLDIGL